MSVRVDTTSLIAGACVVGNRGLGVTGAVIRASTAAGEHGAGYLYNDVTSGDDAKEVRGLIVTPPVSGTLVAYEDGSFDFTAPSDGSYSFTYRLFVDGADLGTATASFTVGTGSYVAAAVAGTGSVTYTGTGAVDATIGAASDLTAAVTGIGAVAYTGTGAVAATVVDGPAPVVVPQVQWEAWEPYVLPYAPGCPGSTMEHHVRQAAIDFFRATFAWQADLTTIQGDGASTVFAMPTPAGASACKLLTVTVNVAGYEPMPVDVVTPEVGATRIRDNDLRPCAFTGDLSGLVVWPAQPATASIAVKAAMKPTQAATEIPASLFEQHANDIAAGALSTLLALPKQEWTDRSAALSLAVQFNSRKSIVARAVERGLATSRRRPTTRWF